MLLECIYFFIIGAFVGWMLECVFKLVSGHVERVPGILNTPFCILYGLGTLTLSMIINKVTNNFILLFILSMIVLTTMEYVTFILLKKVYGIKLWDYSDMKLKINEKICVEFSLIWGFLGALYIKFLLPLLTDFFVAAQGAALTFSLYLILSIIVIDFIWSSYVLIKTKKEMVLEQNNR